MAEQMPYMPWYGKDFITSERVMALSAAGERLYMRMLWIQWEKRSCPSDVDLVARMGGIDSREARKAWPEVIGFFKPAPEAGRIINDRLEQIRAAIDAKAQKKAGAARANGTKGGRPNKPKEEAEVNPPKTQEETQEETHEKPTGLSVGSENKTQEVTQKNPAFTEPEPEPDIKFRESSDSPEIVADPPPPVEPFAQVESLLRRINDSFGIPAPTSDEIRMHLRPTGPVRKLLDKLGEEATADLYVFVTEHKQLGLTWGQIWTQQTALLAQMKNGVSWIDRRDKPQITEPRGADPDRRKPAEGVDFWLGPCVEGDSNSEIVRFAVIDEQRTRTPFDEEAWRNSRRLSA